MCGIAGFIGSRDTWRDAGQSVQRMCDAIAHRGPDDSGMWLDEQSCIAFGHRRLSIVDLSKHGHQPMMSADGRFVISFNGEIYNHLALRAVLNLESWRGHSDTETIVEYIARHGLSRALNDMVGMFSLALWDRASRTLSLARDRMGEKPLYYGVLPSGEFVFGSELHALRAHPRWKGDIDRDALTLYLRHNCVPAPWSIYRGIFKLRPGCILVRDARGELREANYWNVRQIALGEATSRLRPRSDSTAIDGLEKVLEVSVAGQMLADVPLGAFLSGGVDSSLVVALMARQSTNRIKTFSIGFSEPGYDEAVFAKAVAKHIGTDHTELYVTAADALNIVPRLPQIYDEPFADSSQIPTFMVAQLARKSVSVALSGDGGDELFAGYSRYLITSNIWGKLQRIPLPLRKRLASVLLSVSPDRWSSLLGAVSAVLPSGLRFPAPGDKLHKFADTALTAASVSALYLSLVSHWQVPEKVVLGGKEPPNLIQNGEVFVPSLNDVEGMSLCDQMTYLPDDILVKVDRASMAVSLETRVPLLDHRVVEYAWTLPLSQKIRGGKSKWALRQVLYRHVPANLIERPKQGFAVPLDSWLRGPLREWAESLLSSHRLKTEGFFNASLIHEKWSEHLSGQRNWQYPLWDVLMFQAWHESLSNKSDSGR